MAEGYNRVLLLGNLGADPELRVTQGGQSILKFRLATTERYMDKAGVRQERTEWHNVSLWGKRGEALHRFLSKGTTLFVEGSLRTSSYEDRDGNKRYRTEIVASNVVFAGGSRAGAGRAPSGPDDDMGGPPPARQQAARPPQRRDEPDMEPHDEPPPGGDFNDDDIPF